MSLTPPSFKVNLPFPCRFITTEFEHQIFISAVNITRNNREESSNQTSKPCVTINLKKPTNCQLNFSSFANACVLGVLNNNSNNKYELIDGSFAQKDQYQNDNNSLHYVLITDNKKKLKKKSSYFQGGNDQMLEMKNCDYFIPMQKPIYIHGAYNNSSYFVSKINTSHPSICNVINLNNKFIQCINKLSHWSLAITYGNQVQEDDVSPDGMSCLDFETGYILWTYCCRDETKMMKNFVPINNTCLASGLINDETEANLYLFDTRTRGMVSLLDSSRDDFGPPSWFPHFDMLYKSSDCELATFWGASAARIGHIVKLDLRFPLRKEIIKSSVEHFRFFHKWNRGLNQQGWMICNTYEKFKYCYSVLSQIF